ncbi:protein translocase subunit SecF [Psychromonas arctica]|uniref:Protein-export membrane protein SecF n=1 Tax=Psychromonas arctica TaxID=168275 RepID=A0ABU9H9K4_9GAMM
MKLINTSQLNNQHSHHQEDKFNDEQGLNKMKQVDSKTNRAPRKGLTLVRYIGLYSSIILILLSLLVIQIKGFNLAVDFTGGVITEIQTTLPVDQVQLHAALEKVITSSFSLTHGNTNLQWSIHQAITGNDIPDSSSLMNEIIHYTENGHENGTIDNISISVLSSSVIGPQVGDELVESGGIAMIASLVSMLLYLSLRFEWRLASGAVLALFHDIILVLGVFSLFQLEFDLTVLAAILAVIGYSLNDSIVISDRIREMLRDKKATGTLGQMIDSAIISTLTRTLITSGTTLSTVSAIWLLAGQPLQGFSIALFVGIMVGTYSSIFLSATIPELLNLNRDHYQMKESPVEIENYA